MKLQTPYQCDQCGQLKQASNHWWLLLNSDPNSCSFTMVPWEQWSPDSDLVSAHLCSESCAIKALSKWMNPYGNSSGRANAPVQFVSETLSVTDYPVHPPPAVSAKFAGPLAVAVQTYSVDCWMLNIEQIQLIREYLRDWIYSPAHESVHRGPGLWRLQAEVDGLTSSDEINQWIHRALTLGFSNPLTGSDPS